MDLKKRYGVELILDLHGCDISTFTKENLGRFFVELCDLIEMKRHGEPMYWFDDSDIPHLRGVSGIQFIETSDVVVHCLDILEAVYLNLFSCKEFDPHVAEAFIKDFFGAKESTMTFIDRI